MHIYVLGLLLFVLVLLVALIVSNLRAMIRERRALLAVGPLEWRAWPLPAERPQADACLEAAAEEAGKPVAGSLWIELQPSGGGAAVSGMAPQRRRQLVSLLEQAIPGSPILSVAPGCFQEVEGRLEEAFEALCDERLDLAGYTALIDKEYDMALRQQAHLGPLADELLKRELDDVIAALTWCQDWARAQD